ncbi:hypothetical protein U9M48_011632, partial [Paspalum notatum var. saurae]
MALRFLGDKVGITALRRASAPRFSPSAGISQRLTSRSYQGGHNNGAGAGGAKKPTQGGKIDVDADIAEAQARFEANCEAIKKVIRDQQNYRRLMIGSGCGLCGWALNKSSCSK